MRRGIAIGVTLATACDLFPSLGDLSSRDGGATDSAPQGDALCDGVDAFVCSDFDHGPLLTGGWNGIAQDLGTIVALSDASAFSAPLSLHAQTLLGDAGTIARLRVILPKTLSHVRVEARLRIPQAELSVLSGAVDPIELLCANDPAKSYSGFWLRLYANQQLLAASGGGETFPVALPLDQWTHFVLDARYTADAGSPSHVTVTVDGVDQVAAPTGEMPCVAPVFELNAGAAAHGTIGIDIDDVIVTGE